MFLQLRKKHLDLLKKETKRIYPVEACAILFGTFSKKKAMVKKIEIVPNKLQSSKIFEVNPEIVASAITRAEKENMEFIGLFHSHPAPAFPSMIDLKFMKLWGDAIWLILSSVDESLAAFQLDFDSLKEVSIKIS